MRTLIAVLLLALAALAQEPPDGAGDCSSAGRLLRAATPLEKAWGAHLVLRCHAAQLTSDLVTELAASSEDSSLVTVLLDALIQLRQPVEPALLMRFLPRWRAEVIILLVRNAASDEALRALTWNSLGWNERLAVFNTLVRRRAPGVVARLLSEIPLRHVITVTDPNNGPGFGGGIGGGSACGTAQLLRGFPPSARYTLEQTPAEGDVLLADGPEPVYYRRVPIPTSQQVPWSQHFGFGEVARLDTAYLAVLAGLPADQVAGAVQGRTRVRWKGLDAYRGQAARGVASQREALAGLLERLTSAGLLAAGELAELHLRLEVKLEDTRAVKNPPLEPPPAVELANR